MITAVNTESSNIVNSLKGTGSLTSSSPHLSSIQSNINNALAAAALTTNKTGYNNLLTAQKSIAAALASNVSASTKSASLTAATNALTAAQKEVSSLSSTLKSTPTLVSTNKNIIL
jgi:hypothetical protein